MVVTWHITKKCACLLRSDTNIYLQHDCFTQVRIHFFPANLGFEHTRLVFQWTVLDSRSFDFPCFNYVANRLFLLNLEVNISVEYKVRVRVDRAMQMDPRCS